MYKLLIVDDEEWIREGLARTINWENYGVSSVRSAADAMQAMKEIKDETPDLLISDVVMPEMKGTELIKWIHENYPRVKTIMISGFGQFEYARDALRMGAVDYILKPVDEVSLVEAVKRAIDMIREEEKKQQPMFGGEQDSGIKQLFYMKLTDPKQPVEAVKSILGDFLGIDITGRNRYCSVLCEFAEAPDYVMEDISARIDNGLNEALSGSSGFELIRSSNTIAVIAYSKEPDRDLSFLLNRLFMKMELGMIWGQFYCYIGGNGTGIEGLRKELIKLERLSANSLRLSGSVILPGYELIRLQKESLKQCTGMIPEFLKSFRENGIEWAAGYSGELLDRIIHKAPYISKSELGSMLFRIMIGCITITEQTNKLLKHQIEEDNEVLTWVFSLKQISEAKSGLEGFFDFLADSVFASSENVQKKIIRDSLEYIHQHYKNAVFH